MQTNSNSDHTSNIMKSAVNNIKEESGSLYKEAKNLTDSGVEATKEKIKEVEDLVKTQSDAIVEYIKEHPVKSTLMALGAGYAISCLSKK